MSKPDMKEFRALLEQGPAVAMVAKDDMLKLLDVIEAAQTLITSHHQLFTAGPDTPPHLSFYPLTDTGFAHAGCHLHRMNILSKALYDAGVDPFGSEHVSCTKEGSTPSDADSAKLDLSTTTPAGRA